MKIITTVTAVHDEGRSLNVILLDNINPFFPNKVQIKNTAKNRRAYFIGREVVVSITPKACTR